MESQGKYLPEFYFQWGNEPAGMVSTGCYVNDTYVFVGYETKKVVNDLGLIFHNPHS